MADTASALPPVTLCLLAGGEGRRMGGRDKGLVMHQGQALAAAVIGRMGPQVQHAVIVANRHPDDYARLWATCAAADPRVPPTAQVCGDDDDLPRWSGPLAGMITALRHSPSDWVQFVPCDAPRLPDDLVARLCARAMAGDAQDPVDLVVPLTHDTLDGERYHWVTCLVHRRVAPTLVAQFVAGERKVSRWAQGLHWRSEPFDQNDAFANINVLEPEDVPR